jgi:hypothetical protein
MTTMLTAIGGRRLIVSLSSNGYSIAVTDCIGYFVTVTVTYNRIGYIATVSNGLSWIVANRTSTKKNHIE